MASLIPVGYRHYKPLIEAAAAAHKLDPVLVAALVWQESAFNTDAFRYEPDFWNRYLKTNAKYRHLNPRRVSSSYGLMQVMYCRILEDRLADNDAWAPELLFVPENGLDIGCALLRELLDWAASKTTDNDRILLTALAAYNGGRGGNDPSKNWPPRNAAYAQAVLAKHVLLEREHANGANSR